MALSQRRLLEDILGPVCVEVPRRAQSLFQGKKEEDIEQIAFDRPLQIPILLKNVSQNETTFKQNNLGRKMTVSSATQ